MLVQPVIADTRLYCCTAVLLYSPTGGAPGVVIPAEPAAQDGHGIELDSAENGSMQLQLPAGDQQEEKGSGEKETDSNEAEEKERNGAEAKEGESKVAEAAIEGLLGHGGAEEGTLEVVAPETAPPAILDAVAAGE